MTEHGIDFLRKKLKTHKGRVDTRYNQYDMKHIDESVGITIPHEMRRKYRAVLGWCGKAVDSLADRLSFREFENDDFMINEIFEMNNPDVFFDSVILSTLIASCSFVYISLGHKDEVRLQVIESNRATGIIDPITGLLTEGYAVLKCDEKGKPNLEAYFLVNRTDYYEDGKYSFSIENNAGQPLLVPVIHRPDAVRPFGRSRITRSGMYYQSQAKRTLERADVTAEFYSFPQKWVSGTDQDADPINSWKATMSAMIEFTKGEDGTAPKLGQFQTSSMSPFMEQLKTSAAGFAGDSGLTLDDLGFVSDNPSSAEAIKSSHENLRLSGRKAQKSISSGLLNVGYVSACLRDNFPYERSQFRKTRAKWEPLFEADANTLMLIGDGAIKLNQALPGYINEDTIRDLTGIKGGNK